MPAQHLARAGRDGFSFEEDTMKVIIVVEGGVVQQVVSTDVEVEYRVLDIDDVSEGDPVVDYHDTTDVVPDEEAFINSWTEGL